ncbi:unnamed protein product [Lathyrus sativus]|nr:unnamed protein product [Lathyrus sativus]
MNKVRHEWNQAMTEQKFKFVAFYKILIDNGTRVPSRKLIRFNKGQPRAVQCLWQACHGNLATKEILKHFGMIEDNICNLCKAEEETMNHLFSHCPRTRHIWKEILEWFNIQHEPQQWEAELIWITDLTKGKGWKAGILKMLTVESVYSIWKYRNSIIFENIVENTNMVTKIIDNVIYRGWQNSRIRKHLISFMM